MVKKIRIITEKYKFSKNYDVPQHEVHDVNDTPLRNYQNVG